MAVESKPLFNPEILRRQLKSFTLPDSVEGARPRLQHWADLIASGKADGFNEISLLPDFIFDFFDLATEALSLERAVSDLVNQAYGLTPEEIALMWDTTPPRMPFARPV